MQVFDRINIWKIVKKHFETLYDYGVLKNTQKRIMPLGDKVIFIWCPIFLSILLYWVGVKITEVYIDILITSLSIFVGLLFSLLTLVFDLAKKENELREIQKSEYKQEEKLLLLKELFINVSFAILISIFAIMSLLLTQFHPTRIICLIKPYKIYDVLKMVYPLVFNIISIILVIEFILVLLMILKRFFLIYQKQFD